jgi:medium-chain acyl-[acyl-carrier-protein] hydrolase
MKEAPFTQLYPLIETIGPALLGNLDRPFAFFGYSLGARVCFEVTRWLRRHHASMPRALFVAARIAPHVPGTEVRIHDLPEPEFVEELSKLGGTPQEVLENPALMQLMIPLLRADFALSDEYSYHSETALDCPIIAFGGLDDEHVSKESLESWQDHTSAEFELHLLPGTHFFMHTAAPQMLRIIDDKIRSLG